MCHPPVAPVVPAEPLGTCLDPHPSRCHLAVAHDVHEPLVVDVVMSLGEVLVEVACPLEEIGVNGHVSPRRHVVEPRAIILEGPVVERQRRRQQLVHARERGHDPAELGAGVLLVDGCQPLEGDVLAGEQERDRVRAAVGRAQHDEPATVGVAVAVDPCPGVAMVRGERAGDEAAHRVGDQMERVSVPAVEDPMPDVLVEPPRRLLDVDPPVEREQVDVPPAGEADRERCVCGVESGGDDVLLRMIERQIAERALAEAPW